MDAVLNFVINEIFGQGAIFLALIALIGLILQKKPVHGSNGLCNLYINNGCFKACREIWQINWPASTILCLDIRDDSRFKTGQAKTIVTTMHHGSWKMNRARVTFCRKL